MTRMFLDAVNLQVNHTPANLREKTLNESVENTLICFYHKYPKFKA